MSAPSVRRVDQLSGQKAPDVFFAALDEASDTIAELDALREKAVRVDELEAENAYLKGANAELNRQLGETRKALGWERE